MEPGTKSSLRVTLIITIILAALMTACTNRDSPVDSWLPKGRKAKPVTLNEQLTKMLDMVDVTIRPLVCDYQENTLASYSPFRKNRGKDLLSAKTKTGHWQLMFNISPISDDTTAVELHFTYLIKEGHEDAAGVAVAFDFQDWSKDNYIFVPSAAYNGNRFKSLPLEYPPFLSDSIYYHKEIPNYITDVPRLNIESGPSRLELLTTSAATPMVGIYNPKLKKGLFLYTKYRTSHGVTGLILEESRDRKKATLVVSAPGVRKLRYHNMHLLESEDRGIKWEVGNTLNLGFHLYVFDANNLQVFMKKFFRTRKRMFGRNDYPNIIPYSAALKMEVNLQNRLRWYAKGGYYKNGNGDSPYGHIQLGWVGGLMQPYPLLISGDRLSYERSLKTINTILTHMQGESGLFYGIYKNGVLYGDNFKNRLKKPEIAMIRKNGDALYFVLKEFMLLRRIGHEKDIRPAWEAIVKRWADALVRMWDENGQFGQFVNVKTGQITIGGSTAGASIPAALALASEYFHQPIYLETAEKSAKYFYNRFVKKGFTTGGPGEILQNPDSESAFALLKSFVGLYALTQKQEWLTYAEDIAHLCSSWVVSYDFKFPENSTLGKVHAKSTGAVWASTQNKHAAPGICTWSGISLLKLYRATGNIAFLELLKDIAHNILQYMSTSKRPVGSDIDGYINERVNISDWEGQAGNVGPSSVSWVEMAVMLTTTEIPGIYVRPDDGFLYVFDHVIAKVKRENNSGMLLEITNPTDYTADVSIFSETRNEMHKPLKSFLYLNDLKVHLNPGETKTVHIPINYRKIHPSFIY